MDLALMLSMHYKMLRIRKVEERLIDLWHADEIRSLMHLSIGQEAVAVGVCDALRQNDSVVSTHRCHAHYLAKGGDLKKMLAELAGKRDGCCRGRGGSMHLFDPGVSMNLSAPLVGGSIPVAVGIGLSIKIKGPAGRVSVAFFGDGAVEEGVFWESLNFAVVHYLPVLFVCENNLYATHAHILKRQPGINIAQRMKSHGVYSAVVDGNNVEEVFLEAQKMVSSARRGIGPSFLEAKTYRWKEHWGPGDDWHLGYRAQEEGGYWKKRCPIKILRQRILEHTDNSEFDFSEAERKIEEEIDSAVNFAAQSPKPRKEELFQ